MRGLGQWAEPRVQLVRQRQTGWGAGRDHDGTWDSEIGLRVYSQAWNAREMTLNLACV